TPAKKENPLPYAIREQVSTARRGLHKHGKSRAGRDASHIKNRLRDTVTVSNASEFVKEKPAGNEYPFPLPWRKQTSGFQANCYNELCYTEIQNAVIESGLIHGFRHCMAP
ncbi:MAG: hypothetical protein ABFD11_00640, partial [Christensenella sp.]